MGRDIFAVDLLFRNTVLVNTQTGKNRPGSRVDLGTTITDDTDNDLLPRVFAPCLAVRPRAHVLDVLEHADQRSGEEEVILVVHCDGNEEFRMSGFSEKSLTQGEAILEECRRVTRCGGISHVSELITIGRFGMGDSVK